MAGPGVAMRADSTEDTDRPQNGERPRSPVRRRPLPGGRAVVGGFLVAASAVGMYAASARVQDEPGESYVVTRHALAPGARLAAADLTRTPLELPPSLAARAFREPHSLVGATVVAPLAAGELVQASAVIAKPSEPASREVTFAVPRATLAASLEAGERIDVIATYGSGAEAVSTFVLRQAMVVALDGGRPRVPEGDDVAVTVAVADPSDAVALAHAVQMGRLTVVRSTGAPPLSGNPPTYRPPVGAGPSGRT
jgi:Flp pilus assembly protein CpaB